jgi:CheY-like chemotaxis protein
MRWSQVMGMVTPLTITGSVYMILVVDDEPDIVNLAKMILEGEGYHVAAACNGEEALQRADAEVPDLVLLRCGDAGEDQIRSLQDSERSTKSSRMALSLARVEAS